MFFQQAKEAIRKHNAERMQDKFLMLENPLDQTIHKSGLLGSPHGMKQIEADLKDPSFKEFVKRGYDSDDGYSIRINPETGQKEMFVAGTRHGTQWALNFLDALLYPLDRIATDVVNDTQLAIQAEMMPELHEPLYPVKVHFFENLDLPRHQKQEFFEKIAEENGVEVLYGHSRGGAMIADMNTTAKKVGLDAAMAIARNKDVLNIDEHGSVNWNPASLFDAIIGLTGEDNVHYDASPWSPHKVWST